MATYTIEWDMERNGGEFPPEHLGLDMESCTTTIKADNISEFKYKLLNSLWGDPYKHELNPLGWSKVELRKVQEVYIGWIIIER